ncbi:hypothetical protein O6H91_01G094900 [Diphasiastrum complanatum]|uniref:Uncharacterized protein n=1 Tax=Diphasiastrum complanatum TaxID=34168 RepID=A0ACC2ETI0_DIPCM|nr:hypothetical protein O6H91_01G094900 [Diphasiastrum complanatum]
MGRSSFKLPQITPPLWFSTSSSDLKEAGILQRKRNGRMIFGSCQPLDSVSEDVRSPLPAKMFRAKPEDQICSSSENARKGGHACLRLSTTGILSKRSHSRSEFIPKAGMLTPANHGISGTPIRYARRDSNISNKGAHVKSKRSLAFGCGTYVKPQAADCSKDKCGFEKTSAALPNLDITIDEWEKDNTGNELATVKNKLIIVREKVKLQKRRSDKRMRSPSLKDSFDASKVNQQKTAYCPKVYIAGSERRATSSICSYKLDTSSMVDASLNIEHCAWDREPSSSASECTVQRPIVQEPAFLGSFSQTRDSADLIHQKVNSLICRSAEKYLEFQSVAPKLANGSRRTGNTSEWRARRKGYSLSKSLKKFDRLDDRFPAVSKDYRCNPDDPQLSLKDWIGSPPSNTSKKKDCNSVSLENRASSIFYSSPALSTAKLSRLCGLLRGDNQDPLAVEATVSPLSVTSTAVTSNEKAAARRKAQCCSRRFAEAPLQIVPFRVKKVRKVRESIAMIKSSYNPYRDFKTSMLEMILSKKIQEPAKLKELLECYIALNSLSSRELIIAAFEEVYYQIFSKTSAQLISPPSNVPGNLHMDTKQSHLIRGWTDTRKQLEFF